MGEAQRALITPDELRTMHDEVFMVVGDRHPIRARQRRYYDDPALARRVPTLTSTDPLVGGADNPYPSGYPSKPTISGEFGQDSTSDNF